MSAIATTELMQWLDATLQPQNFRDYCPNGLQVAGKPRIRKLVTGVTASKLLLQAAIARKADAVLVHHGWFWKNENPCLTGSRRERVALALQHNLNVIAYHLPLDAHPALGNNAALARVLDLQPQQGANGAVVTCGESGLIWLGTCPPDTTLATLERHIAQKLGRTPLVIAPPEKRQQTVGRIAWCTGAAQGIGLACAERFLADGARVLLADVPADKLAEVVARLGEHAHGWAGDFAAMNAAMAQELVAAAVTQFGRLDVLVNNAGIIHLDEFIDFPEDAFDRVQRINLKAPFLLSQAAARQMIAQSAGGAIVNMSSINSELAIPNSFAYAVSKGGIKQLTAVSSVGLIPYGIRVNDIGPGTILTDMVKTSVMANDAARLRSFGYE